MILRTATARLAARLLTGRKVKVWILESRLLAVALRLPLRPPRPLLLVRVLTHGLIEQEAVVRLWS